MDYVALIHEGPHTADTKTPVAGEPPPGTLSALTYTPGSSFPHSDRIQVRSYLNSVKLDPEWQTKIGQRNGDGTTEADGADHAAAAEGRKQPPVAHAEP
jgi:hypothetical protein